MHYEKQKRILINASGYGVAGINHKHSQINSCVFPHLHFDFNAETINLSGEAD